MPDVNPFSGGGFESPVQFGDKGVHAKGTDADAGKEQKSPFDMRFKRDEASSEKDAHKNE